MSKYELKTQLNDASVEAFLNSVENEQRRKDSFTVLELMKEITGCEPKMWGKSTVGFDTYHYKYASGQEADWMALGFSPRKQALTLYIMPGYQDYSDLMDKLGPHKTGKCCLYIKRLSDIHMPTLKKLITKGYKDLKKMYPN